MTTIPKPSDPTTAYTGIYDAWNRLVAVKDGSDYVTQYEYDGAKRRTIAKTYSSGVLSETRHCYYTEPSKWLVIEERVGSSTSAERQFVWGLRYVDDLVVRDRDSNGDGSLDERLYAMQDANWNVTAIANSSGTVQERYAYSAYGVPVYLDAAFGSRGSSSYQWETLYAGYRWDGAIKHYHVRHRVLDPTIGTWLQRDPLPYGSTLNLYVYADGQPLVAVDPSGTVIFLVLFAGVSSSTVSSLISFLSALALLLGTALVITYSATDKDCILDPCTRLHPELAACGELGGDWFESGTPSRACKDCNDDGYTSGAGASIPSDLECRGSLGTSTKTHYTCKKRGRPGYSIFKCRCCESVGTVGLIMKDVYKCADWIG